jgi:hypothetical protein
MSFGLANMGSIDEEDLVGAGGDQLAYYAQSLSDRSSDKSDGSSEQRAKSAGAGGRYSQPKMRFAHTFILSGGGEVVWSMVFF